MSATQATLSINTYLNFNGRTEEAIEFYTRALGAKIQMLMRYKDNPDPLPPGVSHAGMEEKVMHASFSIGETILMASDGGCKGDQKFRGFNLSLTVSTLAEAEALFAALAEGGEIQMPLMKTFFSPGFGMLADRFGVGWMIMVRGPQGA
jgi:PhnB protein